MVCRNMDKNSMGWIYGSVNGKDNEEKGEKYICGKMVINVINNKNRNVENNKKYGDKGVINRSKEILRIRRSEGWGEEMVVWK